MTNIYIIALALATGLNIFYTVYSYNEYNQTKQEYIEQVEENRRLIALVDNKLRTKYSTTESIAEVIHDGDSVKEDIHNRIVETMMSLEVRLYSVEEAVFGAMSYNAKGENLNYETDNKTVQ
jgi:hypothetical protein